MSNSSYFLAFSVCCLIGVKGFKGIKANVHNIRLFRTRVDRGETMMPKKTVHSISVVLLLAYCVPYAFLAVYGDAASGTVLFYGLMVAAFAALSRVALRIRRPCAAVAGQLLSLASSTFCLWRTELETMNWYFKPFSAHDVICLLSMAMILLQIVDIWRWRKKNQTK